ncbi:MAG TPA: DNA polymerase III subunit beta, partial [Pirellulales bacterium]
MKVVCDREKLMGAFQTASAVAPARSPKPILQNVRFDVTGGGEGEGMMMATDLEVGVRVMVPGVMVESPGSAILPIARFGSILRESSDATVRLESDGQATIVRGDRSEFR